MVRQLRRALRLGRDLVSLLGSLGRTLAWVFLPRPDQPGLAILQGDPLARVGTPSVYRVRACNPSDVHRPVQVVVLGWLDGVPDAPDARFRVEWTDTLEPGAVSDRWIRTSWCGDVEVLGSPPSDSSIWYAEPVIGRWHVEARAPGTAGSPLLHASGALVR
jgi:hypothetical protein